MAYRMTVADPRDPDTPLDLEYEARRGRDQPDVGYRAPLLIEVESIHDLAPAHRAEILEQIYARHDHHG